MTRNELINVVTETLEASKSDGKRALEAVESAIVSALLADNEARLGFGVFVIKESKARKARNPKTGAEVNVPAKNKVRFRPAKELKEQINQK